MVDWIKFLRLDSQKKKSERIQKTHIFSKINASQILINILPYKDSGLNKIFLKILQNKEIRQISENYKIQNKNVTIICGTTWVWCPLTKDQNTLHIFYLLIQKKKNPTNQSSLFVCSNFVLALNLLQLQSSIWNWYRYCSVFSILISSSTILFTTSTDFIALAAVTFVFHRCVPYVLQMGREV